MITRGIIGTRFIDIYDVIEYIEENFDENVQIKKINDYIERIEIDLEKNITIRKCIELYCKEKDEKIKETYLNAISIFFY